MNKLNRWWIAVLILVAASCKKDLGSVAEPVNLTVKIAYDADATVLGLSKENAIIKINNLTSGTVNEARTNASGIATFASIAPGSYTVTASITIKAADYSTSSGTVVTEDVVFNGNLTGQAVTNAVTEITVPLTTGRLGNWVFKQIYYGGSNVTTGASFRDQFFEIYNNSTETLYADSLYFAQVFGVNNTTVNAGRPGYLSNNQYDWSQAIGNTAARANEDYVYVRSVYMIPGTGKQYPVKPGESIIVAQTGLNHTASYTMNDGTVQSVTNPALTVDLSKADFEAYLVDYKRATYTGSGTFTPYKWDVDNPAVSNIGVVYVASGNDMILDNLGRDGYVLYQPKDINPRNLPYYPAPTETVVNAATTLYQQIPVRYIIDAVETQRVVESQRVPKRLQNSLDAGPTNVTGGEYTSQSLVRKTKRTTGGRRILQDTNNSANDFVTKAKADPSKTASSFVD